VFPFQEFLTPPPPTPTLPGGPAPLAAPITTPLPTPVPTPVPTATPLPGAPTAAPVAPTPPPETVTPPLTTGTTNLAAIVALLIYLAFFGAIGYRRGARRELWVLVVAVLLAFGLQQFSDLIVLIFDRFGKGLAFITGQPVPEQSALGAWAAANTATLLLLLWFGGVVFTYIMTNHFVRKSKSDGWAVLLGILNGMVFAIIFAPLLTTLIFPDTTIQGPMIQLPVWTFVSSIWQQITSLLSRIWTALGPAAANVFFLAIVVLVLFAAFTLRTSAKPKS
jgi:hypothetical protein